MPTELCPRCGASRTASFRFCRQCQFDYDSLDPALPPVAVPVSRPAASPVSRRVAVPVSRPAASSTVAGIDGRPAIPRDAGQTPAAGRTRPVRILESDHAPLRLVAGIEQRSPAEVIHSALDQYIASHRDKLAEVFEATQRAIRSGDLAALSDMLDTGARESADADHAEAEAPGLPSV